MLSSSYWLLEALRGVDCTGTPCSATEVSEQEREECSSCYPRPAARCMSERDGGGAEEACGGGDGEDGGEDCSKDDAASGETLAGKGFLEFYPFLNDAALNEMDGEARQET